MPEDQTDQQNDAHLQSDQDNQVVVVEDKKDPSDNLTPEHPRFKEIVAKVHEKDAVIDELRAELDAIKTDIAAKRVETNDDELTPEEEKSLERIAKGLKAKGVIVTPEELNLDRRARTFDKLSDKYDGTNGLPKFDPTDVAAHAVRNGYGSNYEAAYRDMHFDAIVQHNARRADVVPPKTEKTTPAEDAKPDNVLSPQDIANMSDADYEANRESILASMRGR